MSTRSMIAIQDADGACYAIYCHFDGYVSHMGDMLVRHFNSDEKAADLVNEGELRSLMEDANGEVVLEHFEADFDKREIEYYDNAVDMLNAFVSSDREYIYLWDDEVEAWVYRNIRWTENGKHLSEWKFVVETLLENKLLG